MISLLKSFVGKGVSIGKISVGYGDMSDRQAICYVLRGQQNVAYIYQECIGDDEIRENQFLGVSLIEPQIVVSAREASSRFQSPVPSERTLKNESELLSVWAVNYKTEDASSSMAEPAGISLEFRGGYSAAFFANIAGPGVIVYSEEGNETLLSSYNMARFLLMGAVH